MKQYADECPESDSAIIWTCRMRRSLDAKNKNSDFNKAMAEQYQHWIAIEHYRILNILKK